MVTQLNEMQMLTSVLLKMVKGEKPFHNPDTKFTGTLAGYGITCTNVKDGAVIIEFDKL